MPDKSKSKNRIKFPKGIQKDFIFSVKEAMSKSWKELAEIIGISRRTLNDWKNEKFTMSLEATNKLSELSGVKVPESCKIKERYWYTKKAGKAGGNAKYKKYGKVAINENKRKENWLKWWKDKGQFKTDNPIGKQKPIKEPHYSEKLAEFTGIILGDGSISKKQIIITLHKKDDREYGNFITNLIEKLFNVPVGTYNKENINAVNYIVSRKKLVEFCIDKLGLKTGNKVKQQVDIPKWIKENKKYSIACVRGLMDTDGCVFKHTYKSNGKEYSYKKISFTNYSKPLRESVHTILSDNKITSRFSQGRDVRIDSKKDVHKYFQTFGSNNPKHLKKYKE